MAAKELAPIIYEIAKKIHEKECRLVEGKKEINTKCGMNPSSFPDFYYSLAKMLAGKVFQRTINTDIREYMLQQIRKEYGVERMKIALDAFMKHINYYESIQGGTKIKDRALYEKYQSEFDIYNNYEQEELLPLVEKTKREAIIEELEQLKSSDAPQIEIKSKTYARDNKTVAQLKYLKGYQCQICGTRIQKANGQFYIEAAHICPKAHKGSETPDNILILCPNHHKEFDHGKLEIITHTVEGIKFKLNDKEYVISLILE